MLCNGMRSSSLWKQGAEHGVFETQKFVRSRCVAFFPAGGGGDMKKGQNWLVTL